MASSERQFKKRKLPLARRRSGWRRPATRRTTVSLPAHLLRQAERLAVERRQTLSSVIAGQMEEAFRARPPIPDRAGRLLELWKRAYSHLTEEEAMLVDGIILSDPATAGE